MTVRRLARLTTPLLVVLTCLASGQEPTTEKVDEILTVEWHHKLIVAREKKVVFSGGVTAKYGPTVLHCDSLTIIQNNEEKRGYADGQIHIDDPDGDITADHVEFDWLHQTGQAQGLTIALDGLNLKSKQAILGPDEWVLLDVIASPDGSKRPLVQMRTPRVTYRPGQSGVARKASLYAFGTKLLTLPSYRFGSKREEQSLRFPSISYNQGFGVGWQTAIPLDDRTRFNGSIRAKHGEGPGAGVQFTRSLLPRKEPQGVISPQSELNERFSDGYFDNVYIAQPKEEADLISARRSSFAVGATLNQPAAARLNRDLYSKPLEIVMEQARPFNGISFYSSLRLHDIREEGGTRERRGLASITALLPAYDFGGGLKTHARLDSTGFLGNQNTFGWSQVQLGLIYQPFKQIRVGAVMVRGKEYGKSTFEADRLFSLGGYNLRLDTDFGTTQLSFLTKYDNARRKWFDNEISLSQTFGAVIPYVTYREFPRAFTFGFRLKAQDTLAHLGERFSKKKPKN